MNIFKRIWSWLTSDPLPHARLAALAEVPTPPYDPRPAAKRNLEDVRKRFAGDITEHTMKVLHEDGLYRHVRFSKPGSMMYHFDLITWPGYLTIQGDMGGYTFRRDNDMFRFFASGKDINPQYWGEKLQNGAESGTRSVRTYNRELVEEYVKDAYDDWVAEHEVPVHEVEIGLTDQSELDAWLADAEKVWKELEREILWDPMETEQDAHEALRAFEGSTSFSLYDTWEWDLTDYDYHFLWCCFAIQWGVHKFHEAEALKAGVQMGAFGA